MPAMEPSNTDAEARLKLLRIRAAGERALIAAKLAAKRKAASCDNSSRNTVHVQTAPLQSTGVLCSACSGLLTREERQSKLPARLQRCRDCITANRPPSFHPRVRLAKVDGHSGTGKTVVATTKAEKKHQADAPVAATLGHVAVDGAIEPDVMQSKRKKRKTQYTGEFLHWVSGTTLQPGSSLLQAQPSPRTAASSSGDPSRVPPVYAELTAGNLGFRMLQQSGWVPGEGLGKEKQGRREPVTHGRVQNGSDARAGLGQKDTKASRRHVGKGGRSTEPPAKSVQSIGVKAGVAQSLVDTTGMVHKKPKGKKKNKVNKKKHRVPP